MDRTIRLWDLHVVESPRRDALNYPLCTVPLGTIFATVSSGGTVEARTVKSNEVVLTWRTECLGDI